MKKRGQVTIFIIIALILVGIIGIYFSLTGKLDFGNPVDPAIEEVYIFTQSCIEKVAYNALSDIGRNGGYVEPTNLSAFNGLPYYISKGENHMPSKEIIEKELANYISDALPACTWGFENFPEFTIDQETVKTSTTIENDKVVLNVEYPLRIVHGEDISALKNFKNIEIPVRLGLVYDSIERMLVNQESATGVCITCITDVALENNLRVNMENYAENTIFFTVVDESSKIDEENFEFRFANKYLSS